MTQMTEEQKLLRMFTIVHGEITGQCSAEVVMDDDGYNPIGVGVMKNGQIAWMQSREEILFAYVTRDWKL
jgi:hypothetical protein